MRYLIDGYNLLFAQLGTPPQSSPRALDYARRRLLDALSAAHAADPAAVTVVFDASRLPPGAAEEQDYRGLHVRYAVRQDEADDLIEELIRREASPRQLTVVSDDHRIQRAARRRHCVVMSCGECLDRMEARGQRSPPPAGEEGAKPDRLTEEETQRWLREFGAG
ncbi:MAG TPA: NYN domain-containing protein [Gemmataceae bacterium]|nr:NYN domain-containing protein [Gemmataceae bacterium]